MLMKEFVARFSTQDEKSSLFEILRRVSRLDPSVLKASTTDPSQSPSGWIEWPSANDPGNPVFRAAQA
ncbi:MAG: hypothetical protein ACJ76N_24400 [Thermoanaerobaculia bacterium]